MNSKYILRMYRAVQSRNTKEKQPYAYKSYKTVAVNEELLIDPRKNMFGMKADERRKYILFQHQHHQIFIHCQGYFTVIQVCS